jgi:hypothetical protein
MPLTLVQRRALLAAMNNTQKLEKEYMKAVNNRMGLTFAERHLIRGAEGVIANAAAKWHHARALLKRLENKLGVNGHTVNYGKIKRNVVLSNLLLKHHPLVQYKRWHKGLEAEMKRAVANFTKFSADPRAITPRTSPRRATPSPRRNSPRRRTPSPARPANNAHRRIHGVGPSNNTRITWSRNANGKVSIHKTLANINLRLTNEGRAALEQMPENQAMNIIRQLARTKII